MKKNRSFLKWAGGKFSLLEDIYRLLPQGDCLIEPFVGSGTVFLNIDFDQYYLADINSDLINLYNIVKNQISNFVIDAQLLFTANSNNAKCYYHRRKEFHINTDIYQRSLLFLYLNRHCYNGLCRYNLQGQFNVPFGRYNKPYFPESELFFFSERAQKATFVCETYDETLKKATRGSVIYCDPPYLPLSTTSKFTSYYYTNHFNIHEQKRLAQLAEKIALIRNIPILISNHDTLLTRLWYQKAILHSVQTQRYISRNINNRIKVNELLALFNT
ncbi:MAG: Dam family site-specific DNA-(adenine-N6)-methyltransferase [Pantoea sp. Brub]|nr:Dam family site-specific DNA-(adenine-N6)-methyltransferase [Pantoea sp. Brub]